MNRCSVLFAFGLVLSLVWSAPVLAEDDECQMKLPLTTAQVEGLKVDLMKVKESVKDKLGQIPKICPADIHVYQNGDELNLTLTKEQLQEVKGEFPEASQVGGYATFKVAELWSKEIGPDTFICIVVVGSKVKALGTFKK